MLAVTARIQVDPDRTEEFEALARELWEATHRSEPRCRRYEYARLAERGSYLALMVFDDHDAFLAHQASGHHTRIAAGAMRELTISVDLEFAVPLDGGFGRLDGVAAAETSVDPALVDRYADRYPPPDMSAWER